MPSRGIVRGFQLSSGVPLQGFTISLEGCAWAVDVASQSVLEGDEDLSRLSSFVIEVLLSSDDEADPCCSSSFLIVRVLKSGLGGCWSAAIFPGIIPGRRLC